MAAPIWNRTVKAASIVLFVLAMPLWIAFVFDLQIPVRAERCVRWVVTGVPLGDHTACTQTIPTTSRVSLRNSRIGVAAASIMFHVPCACLVTKKKPCVMGRRCESQAYFGSVIRAPQISGSPARPFRRSVQDTHPKSPEQSAPV